jgi:hypothetical protein
MYLPDKRLAKEAELAAFLAAFICSLSLHRQSRIYNTWENGSG